MIEIQEMTAADVADIAALERLCSSAPWSENSIAEELETGFSLWLTARLDGAFAGYVGAQLVPPEADMMNLAVVPELRRRGTAQALLQALQERLAARGIGSLTLEVRASNLRPSGSIPQRALPASGAGPITISRPRGRADPQKGARSCGSRPATSERAVAIEEDGRRILTDCIASQVALHREYGGVVPEIASRKHIEAIYGLAEQALENTGLTRGELDAVAVTYAPGLIGALLVGVNFAKAAALALDVPLIPVHHIKGHIAANYLAYPDLEPPFLCLVVSGGHTMFVDVEDYTKLRILGGTRDDAAGECFDKVARLLGMPYPGGAALDRAAQGGDPSRYPMPRPHLSGNPLDLSFSGLKTSAVNLIHNAGQKGEQIVIPDLCAAFSEAVCGMLVPRAMLALEQTGRKTLAVAGGVAANSRIRAALQRETAARGVRLCMPPLSLCGDNGAMIGAQAYYEYLAGNIADQTLNAYATRSMEGEAL